MSTRVILLDDQVPPENMDTATFKKNVFKKFGESEHNRAFVDQCIFMTEIITSLKDTGYQIITAREYNEAIEKIEKTEYDIAIIDLGWYMDFSLPENERPSAGWKLCDKLDEIDKKKGRKTPQILFSSRFPTMPELSFEAARRMKLPIYKQSSDFVKNTLLATIRFVESNVTLVSKDVSDNKFSNEIRNLIIDSFKEPLREYKKWTWITIVFVCTSLLILISGILLVYEKKVEVGTITSIGSIITGSLSSLLYRRLNKSEKTINENKNQLLKDIKRLK
jgi:DNA-binding NarL/FixJ family response regulator